jgi:hypothetical protein
LLFCPYQILAHELGHNLEMPHDFIDPYADPKSIRYDSKGNSCTNVNGIMDYSATPEKWTTCSVEKFTNFYNNIIARQGRFCMNNPGKLLTTRCNPNYNELFYVKWMPPKSVRPFIRLCLHLPVDCVSVCPVSINLSICLSICPSVCLSISTSESVRLSVCPSIHLSVCQSVCLSVCLSLCPSVRPFICPSVCLFSWLAGCLPLTILTVLYWKDGQWGNWAAFGACSVSCGGGTQSRTRFCNGEIPCEGSATPDGPCNMQECSFGK